MANPIDTLECCAPKELQIAPVKWQRVNLIQNVVYCFPGIVKFMNNIPVPKGLVRDLGSEFVVKKRGHLP